MRLGIAHTIGGMLSHVTIGARDIERMIGFYDAVLAPLGITRHWTDLSHRIAGWSKDREHPHFFVTAPFDGGPASCGNGTMVAFLAPDRAATDTAHALALAHGGIDEGAPGLRPHYSADYYGAYARDPEGNKIHFVHRGG